MSAFAALALLALVNLSGQEGQRVQFHELLPLQRDTCRQPLHTVGSIGDVRRIVASDAIRHAYEKRQRERPNVVTDNREPLAVVELLRRDNDGSELARVEAQFLRESLLRSLERPILVSIKSEGYSANPHAFSGRRTDVFDFDTKNNVYQVVGKAGWGDELDTVDYKPRSLVGDHGLPGYLCAQRSGFSTFDGRLVRAASKLEAPHHSNRADYRQSYLQTCEKDDVFCCYRHAALGVQILISALVLYPLLILSGYSFTFATHHKNPIYRIGGGLIGVASAFGVFALIGRTLDGYWLAFFYGLLG